MILNEIGQIQFLIDVVYNLANSFSNIVSPQIHMYVRHFLAKLYWLNHFEDFFDCPSITINYLEVAAVSCSPVPYGFRWDGIV